MTQTSLPLLELEHRARGRIRARLTLPSVSLFLLTVATIPWRRATYFTGGVDPVVAAKAGLSLLALLLAFLVRQRCRRAIPIGTRSVWLLTGYCTITFFGAWSYGELVPTVVLIVRIGIVAATLMLLLRSRPLILVFNDLVAAMTLIVLISTATGLGNLAATGRLSGGIPPLDPNSIAMMCGVVVIACVWRALDGRASRAQIATAALFIGIFWATGSRTGLAALLISLVIMVAVCGHMRPQVFIALVVGLLGVTYLVAGTGLISAYFERGGTASITTLSSRTVAWSAAFNFAKTEWTTWFGAGLAVKQIPVEGQYWATQILDSSWVSALVQSGYLGVLLLGVWVVSVAAASLRSPRDYRVLLVGLTAYLVTRSILESGLFDSTPTFVTFFLVSLCSDQASRESLIPVKPPHRRLGLQGRGCLEPRGQRHGSHPGKRSDRAGASTS